MIEVTENEKDGNYFVWIVVGMIVLLLSLALSGRYIERKKERVLEEALEEFIEHLKTEYGDLEVQSVPSE